MKIVDEKTLNRIRANYIDYDDMVCKEVFLPKKHGKLIDVDKISLADVHFASERDHTRMIGILNSAPVLVEADKEESEDKE